MAGLCIERRRHRLAVAGHARRRGRLAVIAKPVHCRRLKRSRKQAGRQAASRAIETLRSQGEARRQETALAATVFVGQGEDAPTRGARTCE
jgi:hypothetical protein